MGVTTRAQPAGAATGSGTAPPRALVAVALGCVYLIWGSTYLGIRVAIDHIPPYTTASLRFVVAGTVMTLFAVRGMTPADRPTRAQVRSAAIAGILLLGVGNGGVAIAEQYASTGLVALLIATVPLWMALLARPVLGARLDRMTVTSLVIGFAGVGVLASPGGGTAPLTMLAILISPVAWSVGSVYARRAALPSRALLSVGIQMLAAGLVLAIAAVGTGEPGRVHGDALTWRPLLAIGYLVTFGSFVGFTAYAWLLQNVSLPLASTYAYVNPAVALALGALFLGEPITPRLVLGGAVIAIAVALVVARGSSSPRVRRGS